MARRPLRPILTKAARGLSPQVVRADLLEAHLSERIKLVDAQTVRITLPAYAEYDISAPETLAVRLPGEVLQSRRQTAVAVTATPPLLLRPSPATVSVSFALPGGHTVGAHGLREGDLRTGACALNIALLGGDAFAPSVGDGSGDSAATLALLLAMRSQQEVVAGGRWAAGWDALVRAALVPANVSKPLEVNGVAMNDTLVRLQLPALPAYEIESPETISIVIPAIALRSGRAAQAPDIVLLAQAGVAHVGGRLSSGITDAHVRIGAAGINDKLDVDIVLSGDRFVTSVGLAGAATDQLLASVQSTASPASKFGFEAVVRPLLTRHNVLRLNASALRLRLPASPAYELSEPETLVLNLNATDDSYVPVTTSERLYPVTPLGVLSPASISGVSRERKNSKPEARAFVS